MGPQKHALTGNHSNRTSNAASGTPAVRNRTIQTPFQSVIQQRSYRENFSSRSLKIPAYTIMKTAFSGDASDTIPFFC